MDIFLDNYQAISNKIYSIFFDRFMQSYKSNKLFSCIISGGRSPIGFFKNTNSNFKYFDKVTFFISDERITTERTELNYITIETTLFLNVENFIFNKINLSVPDPCSWYENEVKNFIKTSKTFDMAILGIGADGHIASLFKKTYSTDNFVIKTKAPDNYIIKERITLNFSALNLCKLCIFVVSGNEKKEIKEKIRKGFIEEYPFSAIKSQKIFFLEHD